VIVESHPDLNLRRGAEEAVAMDHVFVSIAHRDRQMCPGTLVAKTSSPVLRGAVLGHEQASAAGDPANRAEKTATTRHLRMCRHLNRGAHPGKLTSLGDDGVVRPEDEFEHRHRGAENIALHERLPAKLTCKCSTGRR
jgi:hypothetical protein